ncbi:MAG: T9SS type A sorting domain-containing protein [Saprospiraceae bacterium]
MLKKLLLSFLATATLATLNGQVLWQEDFEGGTTLPAGWSQTSDASDGGWQVAEPSSLASQYFPITSYQGNAVGTNDDACNCDKGNELLQLPAIDLTGQTNVFLLADLFYFHGQYQSAVEELTLEASTDDGATWTVVKSIPGNGDWITRGVDISAYAGQANVKLAFRYNDGADWLYGAVIDNLKIVVADNILKAKVGGATLSKYLALIPGYLPYGQKALPGTELYASSSISNPGYVPITSFDATLTAGSFTEVKHFDGLDIPLFETYNFDFDGAFTVDAGANPVSVTISNINGGNDNDVTDNSSSFTVAGVTPAAGRSVVVEEGTGTWCGWCPRGAVMMDYLEETFPETFVGVAVHNATTDPMRVATYDQGMLTLISGFPSGLVNRTFVNIDPLEFESAFVDQLSVPPAVLVSQEVSWNATTRKAIVTSHLNFQEQLDGDYRILTVFTQDSVKGTATGYAQVNYYSGGSVGPMAGYENLAATIPAAQTQFDHVARALIGGFKGAANSVPTTNAAGSTSDYTAAAFTVPATQNPAKMHAITMVIDQVTGEVVNAATTPSAAFLVVGTKDLTDGSVAVKMSPNPVRDQAIITMTLAQNSDVQLHIVDMYGKVVMEQNYSNIIGETKLPFLVGQLPMGNYLLTVTAKGQTATEQFSIVR